MTAEGMGGVARKTAEAAPPPMSERATRTGVPLTLIEGGGAVITDAPKKVDTISPSTKEAPVAVAEGRLASAFRVAGETALRWGRKALIKLDGHRINQATKSLDGLNDQMQSARIGGDAKKEAKLAGEIAGQIGEIQRLSNRRMNTATEVKKYYDAKLQLPNKNIARGEELLNGRKIEGKDFEPGLNDQIRTSEQIIARLDARRVELGTEFSKLIDSSQLDAAAKAAKVKEMAAQIDRLADNIAHEKGNLEAKRNVAKSIQDKIDANKAAYGKEYAKLDTYSGIAQDGRTDTEAALLRARQESAKRAAEQAPITEQPGRVEPAVSKAEGLSEQSRKKVEVEPSLSELTTEDFLRGLQEFVNEEILIVLEKVVTSVGGKAMNETKIQSVDFARMWNQARLKNSELPEIKSEHIKKLGGEGKTLAQFGLMLLQDEDVKIPQEVLEKGIKGSAEAWLELAKKNKR